VATDRWWNNQSGETYASFLDTLRADGFVLLDVERLPGFEPDEMLIPQDGHWNQAGHAFVAARIQELIDSHQLFGQP
jgi:hypothetical protein